MGGITPTFHQYMILVLLAVNGYAVSENLIPVSSIFDHSGFRPGGAGPENLLQYEGYWNPNPKPWFVVFDLGKSHTVTSFQIINFGDTTHDVTAFKLEVFDAQGSYTVVKAVNDVETGTDRHQTFKLQGTGRYWRFTVTATAEGFQPYVKRVAFFGYSGSRPEEVDNLRPIIGVLAQEPGRKMREVFPEYESYIAASYVKFLESGGARVVPIMINKEDDYYEKMVNSLNGIVFPGGGASITSSSGYGRAGRKLYDLILESGRNGNPVPLWATCLGFEMLLYLAADGPGKYDVLDKCKASDISIPLELKDWEKSQLFGSAPNSVIGPLMTMNITSNFHKYCVTPKTFTKYNLDDEYVILSNNYDEDGLEFISTVEHKSLPIWGTQWHVEKNAFEWKYKSIPHSPEAMHVGHYFAQFFNDETRRNKNKFPGGLTEERSNLIYNYNPIYLTPYKQSHNYYSSFHQAYFFKAEKTNVSELKQ